MMTPKIRIQSSQLLFNSISDNERKGWLNDTSDSLMALSDVQEYTEQLKISWNTYEHQVLSAITELYGIEFKKSIIDVYVSPWNKSISNPVIINPSRPAAIQIETLVHELLHGLFTDNSSFSMHDDNKSIKLIDKWIELFGNDLEWKTIVHIPVHAGLKAVFIDTLNEPERLQRDIERHQNNPAYKAAWDYVEKHDYKAINKNLRNLYASLRA